ncbi:unnamed protein product [Ranitomeya imitator]|uniref:UPAR/Ly6 domain-containing protein n=1 Tax=Ranitomeya imitator TaxID=111125 RepID=A0ABN9LUY4_9NEOB|nr:unnamed protein product [Ranitomeya imitator]
MTEYDDKEHIKIQPDTELLSSAVLTCGTFAHLARKHSQSSSPELEQSDCGMPTTRDGIKKSEFFGRSCVPEDQCQGPGSFSTHNSHSKKGFSCCYTDNCTPSPPVLPPDNTVQNGLTCPSCTGNDVDWCETGTTMECTGDETLCIVQHSKMLGTLSRDSILRGCATPTICNIGNQSVITDGITVEVWISCTGGGGGLHRASFLYTFIVLILLTLSTMS